MSRVVGNFIICIKMDEMIFYIRERRLLISLYVFVCRFDTVASGSRISVKVHSGDLHEKRMEKPSSVKISPKVLRS